MKLKKLNKDPYRSEYDYIRHTFINELPTYTDIFLYKQGNRIYFTDDQYMNFIEEFNGSWMLSTLPTTKTNFVTQIEYGFEDRDIRFFQYTTQDIYKFRKSGTQSKDELYDFEEYMKTNKK